jgi:hypothetical protein
MGKTKDYYDKNPKAKKKKAATDKKVNARPEQKAKRAELGRKRYADKKKGKNINGKDASHTKNGIVYKSPKANRGSKSDTSGDKRARGGKKCK